MNRKLLVTVRNAFLTILAVSLFAGAFAAPALTPGTWVNVGPSSVNFHIGGTDPIFTQGMAIDSTNPDIIYLCVVSFVPANGGLYKTTDRGSTWAHVATLAAPAGGITQIQEPVHVRVNPKNPQQVYLISGVRGGTNGFWVSTDGGITFSMPAGFQTWAQNIGTFDGYDVAADPDDWNHVLLSFHSGWRTTGAGAAETKDGGTTWLSHGPVGSSGAGMSIAYLYSHQLGIGDNNTWLLGTQADGYWRTSDAGTSWTKVSSICIEHGGNQIYYSPNGTLYASGTPNMLKSTDNGVSFANMGPNGGYIGLTGDGTTLYAGLHGGGSLITAPLTNDLTWTVYNAQTFTEGPFEVAVDKVNQIVYAANITAGLWALRVNLDQSGMTLVGGLAAPSMVIDNATTPVTFSINATAPLGMANVVIDLTLLGGGSSVAMTHGAGNSYSATYTVNPGAAPGLNVLSVTATDVQNHKMYGSIPFTVQDHGAPVLVSVGKTAVASSVQGAGYPASAAIDGDTSSRWSSGGGDPQWIYVDLGAPLVINRVILKWESAYASAYKIQVSNDTSAWTDVFSTTTGNGGTDSIGFPQTTARYVRMLGTQRGTTYGYSLYEFEIYSPATGSKTRFVLDAGAVLRCPALVVSANRINVKVADNSMPWTLEVYSLNGTRSGIVSGRGNKDVSFDKAAGAREFTLARLKTGDGIAVQSVFCGQK
jgi:hypothetical protein